MGRGCLGLGRNLRGNSSYKPPGASYAAQGPQKQPEILKSQLFMFQKNKTIPLYSVIFPLKGAI